MFMWIDFSMVSMTSSERSVGDGALLGWWSLAWRGVDHQEKTLFSRRELGNVVLGMRSTNMLLHGTIPLLL